ncbi:MAG: phosphodiesterase [Syntrophus sp. PtaU1.Bin005]|jgi:putative nucleotidyltransferase with HDIG domain|nr:MAG: phosphodiesterase [Syntrophus sp. PtaB.Bin138]OPY77206.1 MAG: phosphodiesterase [Syntrophus sp. PtaU1.Bin005]
MDIRILRQKIEKIEMLPTVPDVIKRLAVIIGNPKISLSEISSFISSDPILTSRILKMVNSAIFGFPGRISSVTHAVTLLGFNVIKGLLMGVTVLDLMETTMIGLREHSIGCAAAARTIAARKGLKNTEDVSVAGLLHDLGKVILLLQFPQDYGMVLKTAERKGMLVYDAEQEHFSESHATVGLWLAEKWQFPKHLTDVIAFHHKPGLAKDAPMETAIVHLADILTRGMGFGYAGDALVPAVSPAAFEQLNLSEEDIRDVLRTIDSMKGMGDDLGW